jgi:glycosyltransferase involved in cell wall biosynthesis
LQIENKFVLGYAGIFGLAQGLETLVKAAEILKHLPDIHFLFIGDGPEKINIQSLISRLRLANITIIPEQPYKIIPEYISSMDAVIVPLRKIELFKGALPSKMFDAWACERPILLCIDGEARVLLENAQGGIFVPPEDSVQLSNSILELKQDYESGLQMGRNGRYFVEQYYSRKSLAHKLEAELMHLLNNTNYK